MATRDHHIANKIRSATTTTAITASAEVRALAIQINVDVPNVQATVDIDGYLTIAVQNPAAAPVGPAVKTMLSSCCEEDKEEGEQERW